MQAISTDQIELALDDNANLAVLKNQLTGHDYASAAPFWRLYYEHGQYLQREITPDGQVPAIAVQDGTLTVTYAQLESKDGPLPIRLVFRISVETDESTWTATVDNNTSDFLIKELQFPLVDRLHLQPEHQLITTALGGQRYADPVAYGLRSTRDPYCDEDFNGRQTHNIYPGMDASSNCYVFTTEREGLYCGCHDASFRDTVHLYRVLGRNLEVGFAQHLFLEAGRSFTSPPFILSPYSGTWHVASRKYRAWANSWWQPLPKPDWVRNCNGWQRLILKHQDGEVLYPYDALPTIHADGAQSGIKTLFMFGWWNGGMDRMYPDYSPASDLGGEAALRENIRRFQDELGGQVIYYASGRLVDRASEFYRRTGDRLLIKRPSGHTAGETWLFANRGSYARCYGAVELTPACLDCREWLDLLKSLVDQAIDYGCKGVFFDQLGQRETPCWDASHGHPVPYFTQAAGKRAALDELRHYANEKAPGMAFGLEIFTDTTAQYADFIHAVYLQTLFAQNPDWEQKQEKPRYTGFVDWMRYTFPEVSISDRDIRDDTDIERRVNWAFQRGLLHDVEIYRCRRTIATTPHYQTYLGKVNALRERFADLLQGGRYTDTEGFVIDSTAIEARAFTAADRMAIVVCQSHLPEASAELRVPGFQFTDSGHVGAVCLVAHPGHVVIRLKKHGLAVMVFKKENKA